MIPWSAGLAREEAGQRRVRLTFDARQRFPDLGTAHGLIDHREPSGLVVVRWDHRGAASWHHAADIEPVTTHERVLVTGGRDYADYRTVCEVLDGLHRASPILTLIQGGALGADRFARGWAERNGIAGEEYRADWDRYGRGAGPIRNRLMLAASCPDLVVAFPSTGPGTPDMIQIARHAGVPVLEIVE